MLHNPGVFAILVLLNLGLLAVLWLALLYFLRGKAEQQEWKRQEEHLEAVIECLRQTVRAQDKELKQFGQQTARLGASNDQLSQEKKQYAHSARECRQAIARLRRDKASLQANLVDAQAKLRQTRDEFYRAFRQADLQQWLEQQRFTSYANLDAVNTRFIYPFLRRLDYPDTAIKQNHDFSIDVEGVAHDARADWIALDPTGAPPSRTLIVVHTLDAHAAIDEAQIDRARQHAYSLEAGRFVLTNGRQMTVCTRGIAEDKRRLDIAVEDLLHHWYEIESELKPDAARNE